MAGLVAVRKPCPGGHEVFAPKGEDEHDAGDETADMRPECNAAALCAAAGHAGQQLQ